MLQTLVAEIYGPEAARREQIASDVKAALERTPDVVDVDWYLETPRPRQRLEAARKILGSGADACARPDQLLGDEFSALHVCLCDQPFGIRQPFDHHPFSIAHRLQQRQRAVGRGQYTRVSYLMPVQLDWPPS